MSKNIFISYRFEEAELVRTLPSWFQRHGGRCEGKPVYVDPAIPPGGSDAIDRKIKDVMDRCQAVLFVVGRTSKSKWIDREVQLAISNGLPIAAVRLPGPQGDLPEELARLRKPIEPLEWNSEILCQALNAIRQPRATS